MQNLQRRWGKPLVMRRHKLRALMRHIQSVPHYSTPPKVDYNFTGYQEYITSSVTVPPDYFSLDYHCDILHTKNGDIIVGDLITHGLVLHKRFTGIEDEFKAQDCRAHEFGKVFGLSQNLTEELTHPHLEKTWKITSEDIARAIGKVLNGGTLVYHLWDHVWNRCPMTEIAHAGYDREVCQQWEGFDTLPWYLRGGREP
ncbi:MAG: hypothetical protein OXC18_09595 [Desulfurellaceae bacterium]|nr:hypothetical protein [Desulfurellaceae bacterium]